MSSTLSISPNDWLGILFRLSLALLVGAIIGLEREFKHKPAGLRTHMLVSFGAALFVLVPLQIATPQEGRDAISRIIQGVAAGVGFLGAGQILRESQSEFKAEVHGLTSAAAVWVSAALGVIAGCGLWRMALIGSSLAFVTLKVFKRLEKRIERHR